MGFIVIVVIIIIIIINIYTHTWKPDCHQWLHTTRHIQTHRCTYRHTNIQTMWPKTSNEGDPQLCTTRQTHTCVQIDRHRLTLTNTAGNKPGLWSMTPYHQTHTQTKFTRQIHTDTHTYRHTDTHTERHIDTYPNKCSWKPALTVIHDSIPPDTHTDRHTHTHRQTDIHRQTYTHTYRQTDRDLP